MNDIVLQDVTPLIQDAPLYPLVKLLPRASSLGDLLPEPGPGHARSSNELPVLSRSVAGGEGGWNMLSGSRKQSVVGPCLAQHISILSY